MTALRPERVQQALVCMHFDPKYAAKIRGRDPMPELGEDERELLRGVDHRALATDELRRARALQVLVEEYPISAAVVGLDGVDRFFASPSFRTCVFERGSMALAFGSYLDNRAQGVGRIETASAKVRRAPVQPSPLAPRTYVCASKVEPLRVPAGTLAWYQRARQRLGPRPLEALAKLRKPWTQKPPRRGREFLLVEAEADGSIALGTATDSLVELLAAASEPRTFAELSDAAIQLGAEAGDVEELLQDLANQGLLRAG